MTLGVTIHTYQRADGQTPFFLKRAIQSVLNQSYQNYYLIIVGDKYENFEELFNIVQEFYHLSGKIAFYNLPYAKERDEYLGVNNTALWNCGGANALNTANRIAKEKGITNVCHLDHDDYWLPNHLELIALAIKEKNNPPFIHTLSKYLNITVFPVMESDGQILEHYPQYCNLIHSSIYMDLNQIDFEYRDMYEEQGIYFPSDGDMWNRITEKCKQENLKCYVIRQLTCVHENENH